MKYKLKPIVAAIALSTIALSGCVSTFVEPINSDVEKKQRESENLLKTARQGLPSESAKTPSVERVKDLWLPTRTLAAEKPALSPKLSQRVTLNRTVTSISELSERITTMTGVPVVVAPDAAAAAALVTSESTTVANGSTPTPGASLPALPRLPGASGANASGSIPSGSASALNGITIVYSGALNGLLDVAAARYGISWEWDQDKIRFFRSQTRTFRLVALPGDTTLNAKITNQSGGTSSSSSSGSTSSGGSAASSSQEAGVSFAGLSVWKGIEDAVKTMLTSSGKVVVTASTGTITVTDTPQVVAQVEKFIEQQNKALGRQVVVNVRVLSVDLSDSDGYGINWNAVYSSLSGNFGYALTNSFATDTSASNLALKILSTAGSATNSSIKAWAGSEAIISALSKQGRVSQVTSASVTTLNNQPAPIQVGKQTSYLASSTTTLGTSGSGNTTTLQPGLVTTGFAMNLVPHMLDKDRLLLQYAVDLSSLLSLTTVTSGTSSIQTPEIETRNFLQRVMLNSGDTLVVTGFEQTNNSGTMQGVGKPSNALLGGGVNGSNNKTVLVILIQPVVANQ